MEEKVIQEVNTKTKKLTLLNVIAAMFTSIFLVDSIVPAASGGGATIIWYVILGVAFYIPYGLITAEFSSKIPDEGGVYSWVRKTLGIGFAKRVSWYYWVNVGIWAPSIALYIAQLIAYLWFPGGGNAIGGAHVDNMYNHPWVTMTIAIAFMWGSLLFSYFPLADNQKLYTSATISKIVIVIFLFVGMFVYMAQGKVSKTNFALIPDSFGNLGAMIMFLPALVYNILGLEAIAGEASNIKNPKKTMSKATIITMLSLLVFYIATTFAVQYLFNTDSDAVDLSGIIQGLQNAFGSSEVGTKILINILGIMFMYSMFIETMGWVSGGNAGAMESAKNDELPKMFKWVNKKEMPFKSTILLGVIGTIELCLFTGIGQIVGGDSGQNIFWSLFAASSNILFISYFIMFIAYIKAKLDGTLAKLEGFNLNKYVGVSMAVLAMIVLGITWFLLLWSPGYDILSQTVPIIASVLIAIVVGEICFVIAKRYSTNQIIKTNNIQEEEILEKEKE